MQQNLKVLFLLKQLIKEEDKTMKSRYNLMNESLVKDIDNEFYPDVLSMKLENIDDYEIETNNFMLNEKLVKRPYSIVSTAYNINSLDDLLFWINGIGYTDDLKVGDIVKIPSFFDLEKIYSSQVKE